MRVCVLANQGGVAPLTQPSRRPTARPAPPASPLKAAASVVMIAARVVTTADPVVIMATAARVVRAAAKGDSQLVVACRRGAGSASAASVFQSGVAPLFPPAARGIHSLINH